MRAAPTFLERLTHLQARLVRFAGAGRVLWQRHDRSRDYWWATCRPTLGPSLIAAKDSSGPDRRASDSVK